MDFIAADLDGVDDEIGVSKRLAAFTCAVVGLYFSAAAVDLFIEAAYDGGGLAKTRFVNIVEGVGFSILL